MLQPRLIPSNTFKNRSAPLLRATAPDWLCSSLSVLFSAVLHAIRGLFDERG